MTLWDHIGVLIGAVGLIAIGAVDALVLGHQLGSSGVDVAMIASGAVALGVKPFVVPAAA